MPLNTRPIRPITDEDVETYARDGAVCLRQVFDPEWIEMLEPIARRVIIEKEDVGLLPTIPGRYMARCIPEYRKLAFESPLGEVAGRVMQSKEIRFSLMNFSPSRRSPMRRRFGIATGWDGPSPATWCLRCGCR